MRPLLVGAVLFFASRGANAACVISGMRPTVPLPTMVVGHQDFVFIATADCERLRFAVPGTTFTKIPHAGPDTGSKDRTYKVVLTEGEWNSVVDESDTTFTWSIIGTTRAGVTTRVTTTNELKVDVGVTIDLSMADAKLVGEHRQDHAGWSVSGAGDGDGRDDLLVGAYGNSEGGTNAGAAYLVLGPVTGTLDLSLADAKLVGEEADYLAGESVSGAGDVDGDGHADLLVGAHTYGARYLVLGPVMGTLDLSLADAKLVGANGNNGSVSGAGDVDSDGHDDLLVGAGGNDEGGSDAGAAYLVLGPVTGTLDLSLSLANAKLVGEAAGDAAGESVSGAGDVDGDGHDDVLVGAWQNDEGGTNAGAAYLVLGPVTGTLDLALADAKLVGELKQDVAGCSVSGAGDVDGDGHDDVLVGAYDEKGSHATATAGAAYLVLGPVTGTLDLSLADAKLVGEEPYDWAGFSVSGAGDVDVDGHDDLLVGSRYNGEGGVIAGATYLVLGPVTGTMDLSLADAKLVGERNDRAGGSVSGAGDVDGDGRADVLVGAYDNGERGTGAAYLVYASSLF